MSAQLSLTYRLEEQIPLDVGAQSRRIERWTVSVVLGSGEGDGSEIGYAHVLVFTLEPGRDIGDLADHASGTWLDVEDRPEAPQLPADLAAASGESTHTLLLDRVWLEPAHRGCGFGPIVAAAVIARLGRGCRLAALYPAPFEDSSGQPEDQDSAVEALGRVWSKVGFRHWRDGVWMLDLTTDDIQATLAGLVAARTASLPGPDLSELPTPG